MDRGFWSYGLFWKSSVIKRFSASGCGAA